MASKTSFRWNVILARLRRQKIAASAVFVLQAQHG